jgi:hypothetical protein
MLLKKERIADMKLFSTIIPYLLLVSFSSGQLSNFAIDKIRTINESPYHGVAVQVSDAYDTGINTEKDFDTTLKLLKKELKKDLWPWIFFNRFIGYTEGEKSLSDQAKKEYFRKIKGMDIYNESGALGDFFKTWRLSLRLAKTLKSPGIVIDPEAYNNYSSYELSNLSAKLGKTKVETKERLKKVGAQLVDIAIQEYPDAVLWFLDTGLIRYVKNKNPLAEKEHRSVTYVVLGMLEHAKEKNAGLVFISGGEASLGYCQLSLEELKKNVSQRNETFSPILQQYPALKLGATIAPWDNPAERKEWFLKDKCGKSSLKNMQDFKPLIDHLIKSYDYVWIYGAWATGYTPYNQNKSAPYTKVLREIMEGNKSR